MYFLKLTPKKYSDYKSFDPKSPYGAMYVVTDKVDQAVFSVAYDLMAQIIPSKYRKRVEWITKHCCEGDEHSDPMSLRGYVAWRYRP